MKSLKRALFIVLLLHLAALGALAGWLHMTGRLSTERIGRAVDLFKPTLTQEAEQNRLANEAEQTALVAASEAKRVEEIKKGKSTLADRLSDNQQARDLSDQKLERLQRDIHDLRRQLDLAERLLAKQKRELDTQRQAFQDEVARYETLRSDENFQLAVQMYEQLKPAQVKQMFQEQIAAGQMKQTVEYLGAMQLRKAAAVLKEFKAAGEVTQASELIQQLQRRGMPELANDPTIPANANGAAAPAAPSAGGAT